MDTQVVSMSWLIVNNAAVNTGYLFELVFLFSSDKYPEVELLNHMVFLFLIFFLGISIMFSIVAAPIYIPTFAFGILLVKVFFFYPDIFSS